MLCTLTPYRFHTYTTTYSAGESITRYIEIWPDETSVATSRFIEGLKDAPHDCIMNIYLRDGIGLAVFMLLHANVSKVRIILDDIWSVHVLEELLALMPLTITSLMFSYPVVNAKTSGRIIYTIADALGFMPNITHVSIDTDHLTNHSTNALIVCGGSLTSLEICGRNIPNAILLLTALHGIKKLEISATFIAHMLRSESTDFINLLKSLQIRHLIFNQNVMYDLMRHTIINDIIGANGGITELNMFTVMHNFGVFVSNMNNLKILRFSNQTFTQQEIIMILQQTKLQRLIVANRDEMFYDWITPTQNLIDAFRSNITMIQCDPIPHGSEIAKYLERNKTLRPDQLSRTIIDLCMILYAASTPLTPYIVIEIFDWLEPCHRGLDRKFIESRCLNVYRWFMDE